MKTFMFPHRYSWKIRHGWGLNALRNDREVKALIAFCKEELKDKDFMKLNREKQAVFKKTIKLHEECSWDKFFDYVNAHAGWYWS